MGQGEILERVKDARASVNEAAQNTRNVFLFFLTAWLYFVIMVSQTTHEILLKESDLELPVVGVGVPVTWFFVGAPFLLVVLHFNLLLSFKILRQKINHFLHEAYKLSDVACAREIDHLFPFPYIYSVCGRHHNIVLRVSYRLIFSITVIVLPVFAMFMAQYMFLPYHGGQTYWQQFLLAADIVLIWSLWRSNPFVTPLDWCKNTWALLQDFYWGSVCFAGLGWRRQSGSCWSVLQRRKAHWIGCVRPLAFVLGNSIVLWVAVIEVVFPGAKSELIKQARLLDVISEINLSNIHIYRNLYIPNNILISESPSEQVIASYIKTGKTRREAIAEQSKGLDLRGRDLRNAFFDKSELYGANFLGAQLQGAQFYRAQLGGANFVRANLSETNFVRADLRGSSLIEATLYKTDFSEALLTGVSLAGSIIEGGVFLNAKMMGSDLSSVTALGSDFVGAKLDGAAMRWAQFIGSSLDDASLAGADLSFSLFDGTYVNQAKLRATNFSYVQWVKMDRERINYLREMLASKGIDPGVKLGVFYGALRRASWKIYTINKDNFGEALIDSAQLQISDYETKIDLRDFGKKRASVLREDICNDLSFAEGMIWQSPVLFNFEAWFHGPIIRLMTDDGCSVVREFSEVSLAQLVSLASKSNIDLPADFERQKKLRLELFQ